MRGLRWRSVAAIARVDGFVPDASSAATMAGNVSKTKCGKLFGIKFGLVPRGIYISRYQSRSNPAFQLFQ